MYMAKEKDMVELNKKITEVARDVDRLARLTKNSFDRIEAKMVTREDPKGFTTKEDLKGFATKKDLKKFATKDELKKFATKEDLKKFATKEDLNRFKDEIIYEFKAIAENIHVDVAGANKDEISYIKENKIPELEERVTKIEQRI